MEGAPEDASPEKVEQGLMSTVPGLAAVSHVHVWQLTSGRTMATLHVRPNVDEEARAVVKRVEAVLREQFSIEHATVGIDWNSEADENICSLQPTTGRQDHSGHDHSEHNHDHDHSAPGHKH